jgi:hypothetical protein
VRAERHAMHDANEATAVEERRGETDCASRLKSERDTQRLKTQDSRLTLRLFNTHIRV